MTEPNAETNPPVATDAVLPAATETEVTTAVNTAASSLPDNPTGKDFAEMINALPERIVDALKEYTAVKPASETPATPSANAAVSNDPKSGPWFGYSSFADFWTGKK